MKICTKIIRQNFHENFGNKTFFCEEWMNIRKVGNIPHVLHSKALSHTKNGENMNHIFAIHNARKPSRLQMLRNAISQRTDFHWPIIKEVHNETLGRSQNR